MEFFLGELETALSSHNKATFLCSVWEGLNLGAASVFLDSKIYSYHLYSSQQGFFIFVRERETSSPTSPVRELKGFQNYPASWE